MGGEGHNEFHLREFNKPMFLKILKKYFNSVELYGQDVKCYGNKYFLFLARILHKMVKLDRFKIRHKILPKKIRFSIDKKTSKGAVNKDVFKEEIFVPTKLNKKETASFLVAVCRNK